MKNIFILVIPRGMFELGQMRMFASKNNPFQSYPKSSEGQRLLDLAALLSRQGPFFPSVLLPLLPSWPNVQVQRGERGLPSCMFIVCSSCLLLLSSPLLSLSYPYKCLGEKGAPRKETRKKGRVVGKKKTLFTSRPPPSSAGGEGEKREGKGGTFLLSSPPPPF